MVADGPELAGGSGRGRLRVAIVGGGVGALEAMLALGDLAEGRVELTLLSPEAEFRYRPASVAVPFGGGQVDRFAECKLSRRVVPVNGVAAVINGECRQRDADHE